MSRITGSEAKGMVEAYAAIYAPQVEEVVEEVVDEDVDQLDEIAVNFGGQAALAAKQKELAQQRQSDNRIDALRQQRFGSGGSPSAKGSGGTRYGTGSTPAASARPATPASASRPAPTPRPAPAPAPAPAAAPAPTNVAKVAPTRPAAPAKPATGMLGKTSFERRTPTSAELKAAQAARASGASPEKALQAAKAAGTTAKIQSAGQSAGAKAFSSPTPGASAFKAPEVKQTAALAATPKPTPVAPRQTAREKMLNQSYEYDAFDLVLEYLIDNGHVETVDEALYVMMEMDAEVIRDIVEGQSGRTAVGDGRTV
jgi:hypothetical protein